jgi:chromosome partitioning protein
LSGIIISVVNQKGGTGKTTVATNLSAYFAGQKKEVLLIDSDPQHSSLDWGGMRPESQPKIQTIGLPSKNLHREVESLRNKYDIIIIDSGGRVTATARSAVLVSDFLILPTLPSQPDILSTQEFLETVVEEVASIKKVQGAVLLNQDTPSTVVSKKAEEYVRQIGYPVFKNTIRNYVAFKEAFAAGLSVYEYDQNCKAADDFQKFFNELKKEIN